jgi:hypothetical protein
LVGGSDATRDEVQRYHEDPEDDDPEQPVLGFGEGHWTYRSNDRLTGFLPPPSIEIDPSVHRSNEDQQREKTNGAATHGAIVARGLLPSRASETIDSMEKGPDVDLTVPGIVLAVTGIVALIVSLTRGPNLGLSRRTGVTIGVVLLAVGSGLLVYTATSH